MNDGTCIDNDTLSLGYSCQCSTNFSGYDCEYDERICSADTCWYGEEHEIFEFLFHVDFFLLKE